MPSEGGYRDEDLAKRVEVLRDERDALLRDLHGARRTLDAHGKTGWWMFFVGLSIFPGLLLLFFLWLTHPH
jgi:hypothetical protein